MRTDTERLDDPRWTKRIVMHQRLEGDPLLFATIRTDGQWTESLREAIDRALDEEDRGEPRWRDTAADAHAASR
jgi:hypothetical protein